MYYHQVKPKLKYKDICRIITQQHGIPLSLRRLKEICRTKKVDRKRNVSDNELREIVSNELSTSLIKVGYRQMTETISVKYNVNISKNDVGKILKELNPSDAQDRCRESSLHVVYMIPTDQLMYTTLMVMINIKGGGLRFMTALTDLVERFYGCMSLQATMIL